MYGMDRENRDTLDEDLNKVVSYLVHAQKTEHASTVMKAVRRLAASGDQIGRLRMELDQYRNRASNGMGYDDRHTPEQIIKLPSGTRKVSIEL